MVDTVALEAVLANVKSDALHLELNVEKIVFGFLKLYDGHSFMQRMANTPA